MQTYAKREKKYGAGCRGKRNIRAKQQTPQAQKESESVFLHNIDPESIIWIIDTQGKIFILVP